MNRGVLVGVIFLYLLLVAYMSTVMGLTVTDSIAGEPALNTITGDINVWDLLGTFFNMLTFQVSIPTILNLFLIYPPLIILIWQIVEILKDLVPFT